MHQDNILLKSMRAHVRESNIEIISEPPLDFHPLSLEIWSDLYEMVTHPHTEINIAGGTIAAQRRTSNQLHKC